MATTEEVRLVFVGHDSVKEINSSLGRFKVRKMEGGARFVKVDAATAEKLIEKYPRDFQSDSGTSTLTAKPRTAGKRTAGLDADEVEDDGLTPEERRLGEILSNPNAKLD